MLCGAMQLSRVCSNQNTNRTFTYSKLAYSTICVMVSDYLLLKFSSSFFLFWYQILMNAAMVTASSCVPTCPAHILVPVILASSSIQTAGPVKVNTFTSTGPRLYNRKRNTCISCTSVVSFQLLLFQMWMSVQMNLVVMAAWIPTGPTCATVTKDLSWHLMVLLASVRKILFFWYININLSLKQCE